ncbi:hypothetical protein [Arthrobacter sp. TMS2-4]
MRNTLWWYGVGIGLTAVAVLVAVRWPLIVPLVFAGLALLMVAAKKPDAVSTALVLASLPFLRPNVLSVHYAVVGSALCLTAAVIAFAGSNGRLRLPRPYVIVSLCVGAIYLWLLVHTTIFGTVAVSQIVSGTFTTAVTTAATGFVLASPIRRRAIGKGFVYVILALSASYVVTLMVWAALGVGALPITTFPISLNGTGIGTIFFPFTPSYGVLNVLDTRMPRFTGLGREPGWMALYCGLALLLWPRVGKPRRLGQLILVAGLLGTLSTAGFGAFAVVLLIAWIMRKPRGGDLFTHYIGFLFKAALLAGAAWVAIYAPILGLEAKGSLNSVSLSERAIATSAGVRALTEAPFGGAPTGVQDSINLIAVIAPLGLPFSLLVVAALVLPAIGHQAKHVTVAPIMLIFVTLLLSQPAGDSTFVFVLVGLIYLLAAPPAGHAPPMPGETAIAPAPRRATALRQ